tara:strand:+ start:3472 stop:4146 length:675 start_codon:yes stop_codon:yes gene_type:complete
MNIKHLSLEERPREKMDIHGIRALTNSELLALIIGNGYRGYSAVDLGRDLLNKAGNDLSTLASWELGDFCQLKGMGRAKACQLMALFELARRKEKQFSLNQKVCDSYSAFLAIKSDLLDLKNEEFWVLFCNNANYIVHKSCMSKGGMNATYVDVRLIIRKALLYWSNAIVLVHNHPSGQLLPSNQDLKLTKNIKKTLSNLEIRLLDHLIINNKSYFSFADEGLI